MRLSALFAARHGTIKIKTSKDLPLEGRTLFLSKGRAPWGPY